MNSNGQQAASALENDLVGLKRASRKIVHLSNEEKNLILKEFAKRLSETQEEILRANGLDLKAFDLDDSRPVSFRDRLLLTKERIEKMAEAVLAVARLPDPVGEIVETKTLSSGLKARRVRSPLGTLLIIFEARPNVISEVFSLAFKSGNAVALRGGSESQNTSAVIYELIDKVLSDHLPLSSMSETLSTNRPSPFLGIQDYDRALVGRLLKRSDLFDVCIPRGGDELIKRVVSESKMPVIKNDRGLCHLYVHESADLNMAVEIAVNAKTSRPSVCNAIETLIVDRKIAREFYSVAIPKLFAKGVSFFGCEDSLKILKNEPNSIAKSDGIESPWAQAIQLARDEDFDTEYLDLKLNLKIVENIDLAIHHIEVHGSNHSETIVTKDEAAARKFQNVVDSACVYWNASTRFTDGFEFGLGGEIGISTQKLHVRGPVGLRELTSTRWLIDGQGHVRS
jgi:glutamate-5-semialdehyde dehydrogenase